MADKKLQQQIDQNLKKVFEEQLDEELPERFTSLLAKLRAADNASSEEAE